MTGVERASSARILLVVRWSAASPVTGSSAVSTHTLPCHPQFSSLGSLNRGSSRVRNVEDIDLYDLGVGAEDESLSRARGTTVLVIGATGRVGQVLVRKLLLRGYNVRALVRPGSSVDSLPDKAQGERVGWSATIFNCFVTPTPGPVS